MYPFLGFALLGFAAKLNEEVGGRALPLEKSDEYLETNFLDRTNSLKLYNVFKWQRGVDYVRENDPGPRYGKHTNPGGEENK